MGEVRRPLLVEWAWLNRLRLYTARPSQIPGVLFDQTDRIKHSNSKDERNFLYIHIYLNK